MKQRSMVEFMKAPLKLKDYNIQSSEWLSKSGNSTPPSTKSKKRSSGKTRSKKTSSTSTLKSPLQVWIQGNKKDDSGKQEKGVTETYPSQKNVEFKSKGKALFKPDPSEKNGYILPSADDILKNMETLKREARLLEEYEDLLGDSDSSRSEKSIRKVPKKRSTKSSNVASPLQIWIHGKKKDDLSNQQLYKRHNPFQKRDEKRKVKGKSLVKTDSFEKYGVVLPSVDDILRNMNTMKEEARILDEYEDLVGDSDMSIPDCLTSLLSPPEETPSAPLLTCEHLSRSQLKNYFRKYTDYLKNISNGLEFSHRHQTFNNENSKSKLTYSFSTAVFSERQLEYLMKKTEKAFDPEGKSTDYLFMVLVPELCFKIFMDDFKMTKPEALDYLRNRPVD